LLGVGGVYGLGKDVDCGLGEGGAYGLGEGAGVGFE